MRQLYLFITLFFVTFIAGAQIPDGYYDAATGTGATLKSQLNDIISPHTAYPYSSSSTDVWDILKETDKDPNNSTNVILLYTGNSVNGPNEYDGGDGWNREHVWAKSHGDFGTAQGPGTDAHHLRPTNITVNSDRGNLDFDNGGTQHDIATECYYDADSWEPRDAVKGDVARMIFYMAVRYEGGTDDYGYDLEVVDYVNTGPASEHGKLSTLIEWHQNDPPDAFEINRNDVIYYDYQGNRNPFIDHPEYVCEIWGGCTVDPEPDNYPTAFSAAASAYDQIDLSWTDATGTNLPDGYLIKASTTNSFTDPADNTDPATDSDLSDGTAVVKVSQGSQSYSFTGLTGETTYYFKVWSYANSGTDIDFKLDGTPPEYNATTPTTPTTIYSGSFETDVEGWTFYDGNGGGADWERTSDGGTYSPGDAGNDGTYYMWVYGYNSDANDWLITNTFDLSSYTNCTMNFYSWVRNTGTDIVMKVSTDYTGSGDPSANGTWTDLSPTLPSSVETWTSSGNVDLSAYDGESSVYIAFYYGGTDVDRNWAIDNYEVTGYVAGPTLSVSPSSLTGFTYEEGSGPSTVQSFTISGSDLDGSDVTLSAPTNYEISESDFNATSPITLSSYDGSETTIYVRLKSGLSAATYNGETISISGGGDTDGTSVSCSGEVTLPPDGEPTNQPTSFIATANGSDQIDLGWTDADPGSQEPAGYLIKANETGTFSDPSDGTDPAEDTDLSDGSAVVKVAHGSGASYSFTGLSSETQYYFQIWSYTNSGTDIDFKLDGTPPTANATTDAGVSNTLIISEIADPGDQYKGRFVEIYNPTSSSVDLTGWEIRRYANANTTSNNVSLSGTLNSGDTYVVAGYSDFSTIYGQSADATDGYISGNGDDTYELYDGSSVVDIYGEVGTDGTGEAWEYEDSRAVRSNTVCSGNTTWTASEWTITAANTGDMTPGSHTCDCPSVNDSDSYVSTGGDAEPATIASTVDTDGEEIQVFDFTFTDAGSGDGLATIIDEIHITQGSANDVADWTNAIAGVYLNGSDVTDLAGTVNSTNITFSGAGMISIANGANETYTLKIYLNTDLSNITDNDNLEFALDYNNITTDASGSSFGSGTPESGDANVAIDITATQLLFVQQPTNTEVSTAMSPNPTVKACDVNGNIDIDYSVAIDVTSSGSLASSPVSGTWSSGVATFADLAHTATGTGLTLTTSNIDLTDISSDAFDITEASGGGSSVIVDFETAGDLYTPSATEGSGNTDVFNRSNPDIGGNSTYIWAVEDLSLTNPHIDLDQIDVSGGTSFTFSIDMLTPNTEDWDVDDELLITYSVDGGAYQNLMWVQSNDDGDDYNAPAALDLAFDGTGDDGEELPAITDGFGAGVGNNFETFTISDIALSGNSTLDIKLQFNGLTSTAEGIYLDNIIIDVTGSSSTDTDSYVSAGSGSEPATLASTADGEGEEITVFDFTFTDAGTSDGLATIIDEIQITQGSANDVADWTNAIAGAYLSGTDLGSDLAGTINPANITFTSEDMISIADGGNETYSLKIYLQTDLSAITDNDNLEFALDYTNITTDVSGSSFGSGAPESGDANVAIDITATKIAFSQQPTNTMKTQSMTPAVAVKACDANGNVDVDYTADITLESTGTMTGEPITNALSSGTVTFDVVHEALATGLEITAAPSTGLGAITSNTFDITELLCTDLMISEYMEGDGNNTAIELFNGTGSTVTLDGYELRRKVNNSGDWVDPLQLTGSFPHSEIYLIVDEEGTDLINSLNTNDVEIDLLVPNTIQTLKVSGDDPIALFYDDGGKAPTMIDVVGDGTNFEEVNLVRNANVFAPNTTFTISEWTKIDPFEYDNLGSTENPLPVTWQNVSAQAVENGIRIHWHTASETNNDYFNVEFSTDSRNFTEIGRVEGAGNTSELTSYTHLHENPSNGVNYYRIKQVDFDGDYDYSRIVSAKWQGMDFNELEIEFVHWSSTEHKALIHNIPGTSIEIAIFNMAGKQVYAETVKSASAYYLHTIDKTYLQEGIYIMRVSSGESLARQKFAVSRF